MMTPQLAAQRRRADITAGILSFDRMPSYSDLAERMKRSKSSVYEWVRSAARSGKQFCTEVSERLRAFAERYGFPFDLVLCLAQHEYERSEPFGEQPDFRETNDPPPEPERLMFGHKFPNLDEFFPNDED